ncbi:hypothetical protein [uncultured Sphingomonas sp.]|uniref:hypothetical protein n=1 Tax=uncultured Sphingomonas sp. TaxID=158754 RepID=UPI00261E38FA|nr:hypothetical protein [uncultured Sphingomonas sp.]
MPATLKLAPGVRAEKSRDDMAPIVLAYAARRRGMADVYGLNKDWRFSAASPARLERVH